MTTFDFSPLYRTSVGFDRLANLLTSGSVDQANGYPPYNILSTGENQYRVTMAVAGFSRDELDITSEQNVLTVTGEGRDEPHNDDVRYLHRGIATRSFRRRFNLADHVRVTGATLENGLLHIELERELPEAMKPRTIEIETSRPALESVTEDNEEKAA